MSERHLVLRNLLEFAKPLDELRSSLATFGWDFRDIPLTMTSDHLNNVIGRYLKGELSAQQVEDWANIVEGREDISLRPKDAQLLHDIVYELANPKLTEELSHKRAREMIDLLNNKSKAK